MIYDPEHPRRREEWLALDESERIELVRRFHEDACDALSADQLSAHAAIHVIVETELAEGYEPVVRALSRLLKEGLPRHDAIHAIGAALAEALHEAATSDDSGAVMSARYQAAVERLFAKTCRNGSG